eukprot:11138711-Lingulodinium_polyedra.AAC.1
MPFVACVARPVGKAELEREEEARAARGRPSMFGARQTAASGTKCARKRSSPARMSTWVTSSASVSNRFPSRRRPIE